MRTALAATLLLIAPCVPACAQDAPDLPAGTYRVDRSHASLIFKVDHLGFSHYTARFLDFDATLDLDPADPAAATLVASIDPASLETDYPDPETLDFNAQISGPEFLDAPQFPEMTYRSTSIEMTGANTAIVHGELTLHGVTAPVDLDTTFNGGWRGVEGMDPNARIGFSAHGALSRSAFGIDYGLPPPGTTLGVGDVVEVIIEAELIGPPLAAGD